ncbi:urease accessory protein UreD [Herbaspirillum hiltneri N3]|uniref:Urease accessory protein UreD n=1 Tax=Herbaspirillum hiltneri N3 TaxID=1262470 RepID=A0ABN4I350_9BURK|nr:urease accessory protein UreD [Herbaspirillum hiltneri]AKZ64544.1 urease accessory protein UreD [Herbaspirillum hiltneri N3]
MKRIIDPAAAVTESDLNVPAANRHEKARLTLGFADDAGTTRMIERSHFGPLRVQKPLYPEHPAVCHAVIVHPPGGILGGDVLNISARVGDNAHALLTTPGAGKWYRANGFVSQQQVSLTATAGAALEWLPQETIFFNDADVRMEHSVDLAADACYIGGEILCFGRTASGESFNSGRVSQCTSIRRGGKLVWFEQGTLRAGTSSMTSPLALAGFTVSATLIAVGLPINAAFLSELREQTGALTRDSNDRTGATQMKQVLVLRYLGNSSQAARQWLTHAWQRIRPELMQREAIVPRIWNT